MKDVKDIVAENLTKLRVNNNLTQAELANRINYTDKSISKWEHGDATPPIDVLKLLADMYGVTLDYLVTEEPSDLYDKRYNVKTNIPNKIIITSLGVSTVWMFTTILFVYSTLFSFSSTPWLLFVLAVPISLLVLLVFNFMWGTRKFTFMILSALIWTLLACVYLWFLEYNLWILFICGAPFQVAIILWSQLKRSNSR